MHITQTSIRMFLLCAALGCGATAGAQEKEERHAVPSEKKQTELRAKVLAAYESRDPDRSPEARRGLARRLMKDSADVRKPGSRFAMLDTARHFATRAKDIALAFAAIERLQESFEVEPRELRYEALKSILGRTKRAKKGEGAAAVREALEAAHRSWDRGEYDRARSLRALIGRSGAPLTKSQRAQLDALGERLSWNEKFAAAMTQLKKKQPKDKPAKRDTAKREAARLEAANLTAGAFLCFCLEDFENGLPRLLKGRDRELAACARRDLAAPKPWKDRQGLGDAWTKWSKGKRVPKPWARGARRRAAHWLQLALADAPKGDLEEKALENQIANLEKAPDKEKSVSSKKARPASSKKVRTARDDQLAFWPVGTQIVGIRGADVRVDVKGRVTKSDASGLTLRVTETWRKNGRTFAPVKDWVFRRTGQDPKTGAVRLTVVTHTRVKPINHISNSEGDVRIRGRKLEGDYQYDWTGKKGILHKGTERRPLKLRVEPSAPVTESWKPGTEAVDRNNENAKTNTWRVDKATRSRIQVSHPSKQGKGRVVFELAVGDSGDVTVRKAWHEKTRVRVASREHEGSGTITAGKLEFTFEAELKVAGRRDWQPWVRRTFCLERR